MDIYIKDPFEAEDFFPELTPLIDVMFLLLVFFMLTTTFDHEQKKTSLILNLPYSRSTESIGTQGSIELVIDEQGTYYYNNKACAKEQLPDVLDRYFSQSLDSIVVIGADQKTPYQALISLYDILQAAGVKYVAHSVSQKK